jgi:S-adenosyl-L-methionine hydrolase (adenosine-forming)
MAPLITLTTDFGITAPYVAVMKGVILSINSAARILDLTHAIRPQDLRHACYFLGTAVTHFPPGTIHDWNGSEEETNHRGTETQRRHEKE